MIARRGLLAGLGALLAAPAIVRTPGLLMPIKAEPPMKFLPFTVQSINLDNSWPTIWSFNAVYRDYPTDPNDYSIDPIDVFGEVADLHPMELDFFEIQPSVIRPSNPKLRIMG